MKGYKITPAQRNQLVGSIMPNGTYYNPVQDINGDWFIFEQEFESCGLGVLTDFIAPPSETII
jgi:hypothetical protein